LRRRKLLLHRAQIRELAASVEKGGLTLVPLRLYLKDGVAKVELGLGRGRRQYDKRQAIAKREADREMQRACAPALGDYVK
jgi:SsrA-binding protein